MNKQINVQQKLLNQSQVSFQYDNDSNVSNVSSVTYSNIVETPLYGPKLEVTKSANPKNAALDETITYSILVRNNGNRAAEVTLYDMLPKEMVFVKNSLLLDGIPQPGVMPGSGIMLGNMTAGSVTRVTFQALVSLLPSDLKVRNQSEARYLFYTIDGRKIEGEIRSNIEEVNILGQQFTASLAASTAYTFLGDIITYTISVTNRGNRRMENTIVTAPIPAEAQFVPGSVTMDGFMLPSANPNQWMDVSSIDPGNTVQIIFQVRMISMPPSSLVDMQAQVQSQMAGVPVKQVTNLVQVKVIQAQIGLQKSASATATTKGEKISYYIKAENNNPFAIEGVVYDALPEGALYVWDSLVIDGKGIKGIHPSQGINLGTLRANTTINISFDVSAPMLLSNVSNMNWRNQARLIYTYRMPDGRSIREVMLSNTVNVALYAPIIILNVTATPQVVDRGDQVELLYELRNQGNIEADVTLTSLYPPGTQLIPSGEVVISSITTEQQASQPLWIGTILPNQVISTSLRVQVEETVDTSIINGFAFSNYTYKVNDKVYQDQVRSNEYSLFIDDPYE
jgi:uncharacterized repeat protein (TIGR01451 family)